MFNRSILKSSVVLSALLLMFSVVCFGQGNQKARQEREKKAFEFYNNGLSCDVKDFDCRIRNFTQAIKLKPDFAEAFFKRGKAYDDDKKYDLAISDYTKAVIFNPKIFGISLDDGAKTAEQKQTDQKVLEVINQPKEPEKTEQTEKPKEND